MIQEEYNAAQALVAEADNEIAALSRHEAECCEQVRVFADARRQAAAKRKQIEVRIQPQRDALAAHAIEQRKIHAERVKAEAEAKAKAAAEAKAAEQSELAKAQAKISELEAALAAKG